MSEQGARFLGTIPELYDRHLGPVIFAPYAADLARRVAVDSGPVLEIACGTGILTLIACTGRDGADLGPRPVQTSQSGFDSTAT